MVNRLVFASLFGLALGNDKSFPWPKTCSGSADPKVTSPRCFEGSAGALGVKEDVKVKLLTYSNGKGTMDLTGSGIEKISCSGKPFTKKGQEITPDISDCLPKVITVKKVEYCSDQDTVSVTVKDSNLPIPVSATLKEVTCSSVEMPLSCSGSADPTGTFPMCYEGSAGALGVKEDVKVKLLTYSTGKGTMDLTGSGIETISCSGKPFTKSGQEITPDISDCLPKVITVEKVEYCSDQDTVSVTVKDSHIPIPVSATLKKVTCSSVETPLSCTGSADPKVTSPRCFEGSAGALGVKEDVKVKLLTYSSGKGTMDLTGSGIETISCSGKPFTKSGQEITPDISDCLPKVITVEKVEYCSDQDTVSVTVKDSKLPIPVSATLKEVTCTGDEAILVV